MRIYDYAKNVMTSAAARYNYHLSPSGYSSFPRIIYININNVCNLRCKMCDIGQRVETSSFYKNLKAQGQLAPEEWKRVIDDVASFKPIIHINGTEPLLYAQLFEIIKYIRSKGMQCKLTTNGVLLPNFAKQLVDAGLEVIYVSIDGPPAIHDLIRGVNGTFDKAYSGIKKVLKIRKELGKHTPEVIINFTVSNYNYEYLADTIAAFDGLDVSHFDFGALSFKTDKMVEVHNKTYKKYLATKESLAVVNPAAIDAKKLMNQIGKIKSKYPSEKVSFIPDMNLEELETYYKKPEQFLHSLKTKCIIPWGSSQINSNGDVIPTDRCIHKVLGNVKEKSFREIWNDTPYREFRKSLKSAKRYPVCARCGGIF